MIENYNQKKVIYGIYNRDSWYVGYIGQTNNLERRKRRHLFPHGRKLRNVDKWLSSINKNVSFIVLEECTYKTANEREWYWKKRLQPLIFD